MPGQPGRAAPMGKAVLLACIVVLLSIGSGSRLIPCGNSDWSLGMLKMIQWTHGSAAGRRGLGASGSSQINANDFVFAGAADQE